MFRKLQQWIRDFKLTLRMKITLSLSAIAVILLVSSIISILEYRSMSNYVSALIADNIESINAAQQLSNLTDAYNLQILTVIGDENNNDLPDFNREAFLAHCDSIHASLSSINLQHLADSVVYSWSAYMLTSLELPNVIVSDFIDTRSWYFERLQPVYGRLHEDIDDLNTAIYNELQKNSATFERGFYRSVIPSAVTVAVGLTLVLLLLFFILTYYVNPIYKMLKGLDSYRSFNTKYNYTFEGDDQLRELNDGITELAEENWQFRRRVKDLREAVIQRQESAER
ncbi:MAG: hypothetical protein IJ578_09965 [Bacteroidales bacterium]|nr:hypothetical protein [Bacteroidales bacterium]